MAITCGHCASKHDTVTEVRNCWEWEQWQEPQEVTCFSCDALIGWDLPPIEGYSRGCGGADICRRDFPSSF